MKKIMFFIIIHLFLVSSFYARELKELASFMLMGEVELREKPSFSEPVKDITLNHEGGLKLSVLEIGTRDVHECNSGCWLYIMTTAPMWVDSGAWIKKQTRYWIFLEDETEIFDYEE